MGGTGCIITTILVMFYLMISGRLLSATEIEETYGFKVLGVLSKDMPQSFHKIIRFGRDKAYLNMTPDEQTDIAAYNIQRCVSENTDILLTGTIGQERLDKVKEALIHKINGICFSCVSNIHRNATSYLQLDKYDNCIMVESVSKSLHSEIDSEVRIFRDHNINVIGVIVIY